MAYRELGVIEIREVLRRFCLGEGLRAIARGTGSDRKTVAKYVAAATAAGLRRGDPGPTDAHVAAVLAAVRALGGGRPGQVPERLAVHREQITAWLGEGLRLTKIHRRRRAQGVTVPYSSLHRFAQAHLGFGAPTVTVRVAEPPPGEAAEVDFGLLGLWFDPSLERRRRVYGLLVTLCFSRYAFLAITLRQDLTAVLDGLESAWGFFGGVVKRLVEDNLKPVVTRADRYTPGIDRVFLEYAQYRGFVVDPAVVRHATGKPKVERGIPYCRQDFFRGETFRDLAEMQARAIRWCRDIAGTRVHGTTRQVPRVVFETVEQPTLLPLAPAPFDRPTWAKATVHPDHHLQFRHALYSVSTRYLGQRVEVRGDSRLVRIYHHRELIKVHPLQPPGGRAPDYTDYPAERAAYAMRAPDACVRQAEQVGPAVGQFVRVLLSGTFPGARLRQAQKLLRLAVRYGAARVNAACARALGFELLDVHRVERILTTALEREPGPTARGTVCPLPARFARAPQSFAHPPPRRNLMEIAPDLVRRLKRLRLGGLLPTLPDRVTHARQAKLAPLEFLELLLQDEIDRRDSQGLTRRLEAAGFEELVSYEQLVWDTPVSYDRARVRDLFGLHWLGAQENVIFCGPVGVGKSWFAQALGHSACRAGYHVRYIKVAKLLLALHQSRADNSFERELRSWLAPAVIILDDFGLRKLTAQQSSDFYDVLVERDRHSATILTSNRAVDEWVALFDDPILANSALDRFAHRAHQIVMEGPSLRAARAPSAAKGSARPGKPAAPAG